MKILGIETSCDETAASVVQDGRTMLSNVIASQIDIHTLYGGVVPEIASRNHTMDILHVVDRALKDADTELCAIDAVAVTQGGGLIGALLVGISAAKALSFAAGKPLIAVNHTCGHIAANYLVSDLTPPYICLVASGGHTVVVKVESYTKYSLIASTVDDAVGEAFDKVARKIGLGYPGGPKVDKLALEGKGDIIFTKKAMTDPHKFSYSGLKTAVINYLHTEEQSGRAIDVANVCASFTRAAIDPLVEACVVAAKQSGLNKIAIAGGVAANSYLRSAMKTAAEEIGAAFYLPPMKLCTDNAAMIASLGYYNFLDGVGAADLALNGDSTLGILSDHA